VGSSSNAHCCLTPLHTGSIVAASNMNETFMSVCDHQEHGGQ
jgi:hypothetical protein